MLQPRTGKTTLSFTPSFRERLRMLSQEHHKSMSQFVEDELGRALQEKEETQLTQMYRTFRTMRGSGSPGITDASSTIDETLYGRNGVWKGSHAR